MTTLALATALAIPGSGAAGALPPSADSRAQERQLRVSAPEKCLDARRAVAHYRALTHERQDARSAPRSARTPTVRGKDCRWARFAAGEWQERAKAAAVALAHWERSVGQIVRRLERGMAGTPMAGTGALLEQHGRKHGVSPYFMVAVAATESSIGRVSCRNNPRNTWGLASCVNSWPVPYFSTWDAAISFYANFLASRWVGHSTPYSFRGYAACSDCWARKVSYWMGVLFGVEPRTRYP